jgi:uncharacterized protein (TIGR02722 family)
MKLIYFILVIALAAMASCGGPTRKVSRVGADAQLDISGKWNSTDAQQVASALIQDCLQKPWLSDFQMNNDGQKPTVIVGSIRNRSAEHIDTKTFLADFERELINSGQVRFVASKEQREELRDEKIDQQSNASMDTAVRLANETGANFMLQGSIKSIEDKFDGRKVVYYQTDVELINLETNEKVWIGQKKIKKLIEQDAYKW